MNNPIQIVTAPLAVLMLFAMTTHAAIIATDDFESYTDGASLNGTSGGVGWTSGWNAASSATVQSGVMPGFGQSMQLDGSVNSNNAVSRTFTAQTGTTYVGFLLRTQNFDDGDFVQFYFNNSAGGNENVGVSGGLRNIAGNEYFARVDGFGNNADSGIAHPDNSTVQIVLRFDDTASFGTDFDMTRLYVNQRRVEGVPDATATGDGNTGTLSTLHIRTFSFEGTELVYVDNFRIGTTFADVVTYTPVPAALPLGLMGMAGVAYLRRRRQRAAAAEPTAATPPAA